MLVWSLKSGAYYILHLYHSSYKPHGVHSSHIGQCRSSQFIHISAKQNNLFQNILLKHDQSQKDLQKIESGSYFYCSLMNVSYSKLVISTMTIYHSGASCRRQSRTVVFKIGYWYINSFQEVCEQGEFAGNPLSDSQFACIFSLKIDFCKNNFFSTCLKLSIILQLFSVLITQMCH